MEEVSATAGVSPGTLLVSSEQMSPQEAAQLREALEAATGDGEESRSIAPALLSCGICGMMGEASVHASCSAPGAATLASAGDAGMAGVSGFDRPGGAVDWRDLWRAHASDEHAACDPVGCLLAGDPRAVLNAGRATTSQWACCWWLRSWVGWASVSCGGVERVYRRREQRRRLMIVAPSDPFYWGVGGTHATSAFTALPGRPGVVVCTSAAVAALDRAPLRAVLASERAHLRSRHDMIRTAATRATDSVPVPTGVHPGAGRACASASKCRPTTPRWPAMTVRVLASALVRLAEGAVPAVAMGAGGRTALARMRGCATTYPLTRPWLAVAADRR